MTHVCILQKESPVLFQEMARRIGFTDLVERSRTRRRIDTGTIFLHYTYTPHHEEP